MQYHRFVLAITVGFLAGLGSRAAADQVYLKDGSVLVGAVGGGAEGVLTIKTAFNDALSIPLEQVSGLSTVGAFVVRMPSDDLVTGALQVVDGAQTIKDAAGEGRPLVLADVGAFWPEGQEPAAMAPPVTAESPAAAPASAAVAPVDPAAAAAPKAAWTGRAELGLNGQSGNKERFDVKGGFDLNRKTEQTRLNLYLKGQYAETNSLRSTSEVMAGTRLEVDFSERTYVFGKVDLEYDEFENLDLRTTLTAGLGHFFVKREKIELKGWAGAGYEHEVFDEDSLESVGIAPTTDIEVAVRDAVRLFVREELARLLADEEDPTMREAVVELGYNYRQDFYKNFRFTHGLTYYPSIDDPTTDYRLAADTAMEFPLGKDPDWTLRTGVRHEYDAIPQEDVDRLDTTYFLNLGFNW